jgi:hypothetical protein
LHTLSHRSSPHSLRPSLSHTPMNMLLRSPSLAASPSPTSMRTFHEDRPDVGSSGPAATEHSCPLDMTFVGVRPSLEMVCLRV